MKFKPVKKRDPHKLAALHQLHLQAYAAKNYPAAVEYALQGHQLAPELVQPLDDAMVSAAEGKMWQQAVTFGKKILHRQPDHLNALHGLSHAYYELGELAQCRSYGLRALQLLDASIASDNPPPFAHTAIRAGRKIMAFSLYGENPKYLEAAAINAELAAQIYPDWVCRFYVDRSVPSPLLARLSHLGAEVVQLDDELAHIPGTMWRFLALDDPDAAYVIFRDADSVISTREALAVQEWLDSGYFFHTIRDSGSHTELILAGMWGAAAGILPNMRAMIEQYIATTALDPRFADQYFLRQAVWQYVRQSLYASDSLFGFLAAKPLPPVAASVDEQRGSIGATEAFNAFTARFGDSDAAVTGVAKWQLYSRINPALADDLSYQCFEQERLICEYEVEIQHNQISALIPQRYYRGFKTGESRIVVQRIRSEESEK